MAIVDISATRKPTIPRGIATRSYVSTRVRSRNRFPSSETRSLKITCVLAEEEREREKITFYTACMITYLPCEPYNYVDGYKERYIEPHYKQKSDIFIQLTPGGISSSYFTLQLGRCVTNSVSHPVSLS